MYLFKWHCPQNAAGALSTVNKVPAYNIGGDSKLATSGPENSSEKDTIQYTVPWAPHMSHFHKGYFDWFSLIVYTVSVPSTARNIMEMATN